MAKKFGKFLLLTAAVSTAAAAAYYYFQKKETFSEMNNDEDYDDFSETPDKDTTSGPRTYVSLQRDASAEGENAAHEDNSTPADDSSPVGDNLSADDSTSANTDSPADDSSPAEDFTPLKAMADAAENVIESAADTVEEFFDENDENIPVENAEDLEATEELPLSDD